MDNIPGTGRSIDMHFYQPVGRAIERFALKIGIRLNICHPSPARILRLMGQFNSEFVIFPQKVMKPGKVIDKISVDYPTLFPGVVSLVKQSQ